MSAPSLRAAWDRYWFQRPAGLSVAIIRIAVSVSLLSRIPSVITWSSSDWASFFSSKVPELFHPFGPLALLGDGVPSVEFCLFFSRLALISTVFALVGFLTRPALVVSSISFLIVWRVLDGFGPMWNRVENVLFLAQIALFFSRAGDRLSVDAWIRRMRGGTGPKEDSDAFGAVLLAQAAVALMFFNAACWKMGSSGLHWIFSDSLRNHMIIRFQGLGEDMPALSQWIADHRWAWVTMAAGCIVTQTLPISCLLISNRPVLRAAIGFIFVLETLGLGLVMDLWEPRWLLLYAVFVDWDYFAARFGVRYDEVTPSSPIYRATFSVFALAFLGFYLVVAFNLLGKTDAQMKCYPFTAFPMYSTIASRSSTGLTVEFDSPDVSDEQRAAICRRLQFRFPSYNLGATLAERCAVVKQARLMIEAAEPHARIGEVRMLKNVYEHAEYPAPAGMTTVARGLWARQLAAGACVAARATLYRSRDSTFAAAEIETLGYHSPQVDVLAIEDFTKSPLHVPGRWEGNRFYFALPRPEIVGAVLRVTESGQPTDTYIPAR